jgi:hypothetical protein
MGSKNVYYISFLAREGANTKFSEDDGLLCNQAEENSAKLWYGCVIPHCNLQQL